MTPIFRAVRPEEQEACLTLWARVFSPNEDFFERYFRDTHWQPHYTRVCEVDGTLVAAVQLVRRPVRLANGHTVWMAGIANVATLPEYRGHGLASQLLRDLHAVMDSEDFTFGLLFTGIHEFYARLGWERLPLPLYEAVPKPAELGNWRFRVADETELPYLQRWYADFYADHPLSVARDDTYWRVWTRWHDPAWRNKFYIAEDDTGTPRGYLALETHYETDTQGNRTVSALGLAEVGCAPRDTAALQMMLRFASHSAHSAGASLQVYLPEADVAPFVPEVFTALKWLGQGGAMVRICSWQRVREALEQTGIPYAHPEAFGQAGALALLFGICLPEGVQLPPELQEHFQLRRSCYSPVDSF